jgi:hypothetical protein
MFLKSLPEKKTKHSKILKSFFNHKKSPEKIIESGLMNFRELNKFPVANTGDKLFFVGYEKQGKPGITFDGQFISVEDTKSFERTLKEGVKIVDTLDESSDSDRRTAFVL